MKRLITILILILTLNSFSQTYILLNKDTLVITSSTTTKTGTYTYTYPETVWTSIVKAYKPPVVIDTVPPPPPPPPPPPASSFQGFGALAVGGSKSAVVYHVTNTNTSGAGSLANGIGSNKTIVFDVSGTIIGRFDLVNVSYLTIDASGQDITVNNSVNGDGISFDGANTHHCILKNVRVINAGGDGINVINAAHDIVIDHCSSYGNRDGNIDVAGDKTYVTRNVTVQYCFIGKGADNDASFSGGSLSTGQYITWHHNIWSLPTVGGVGERGPLVHCNYSDTASPNADVRNNVGWKWGRANGTGSGFCTDIAYGANGNVVDNYYFSTQSPENSATISAYGEPAGRMYAAGNVSGNGLNANVESNHKEWVIPPQYQVAKELACDAAKKVKASAGTSVKNTYELSIINGITLPGCN